MINMNFGKDRGSAALEWQESLRRLQLRQLRDEEIQVWHAELASLPVPETCNVMLSKDESERAGRFRFDSDRRRFTYCRALLRTLLASYLGVPPAELRFQYSHYGKPSLAGDFAASNIRFNVSHSGSTAIFAFTRDRAIGVDVEHITSDIEVETLADRFFSRAERLSLAQIAPEHKNEAFFNCWVRKEAFVKAKGEGLSLRLDEFDVSLAPGEPARLLGTRPDGKERERWCLSALEVGPHYAGAIAIEGPALQINSYRVGDSALPAVDSHRTSKPNPGER
jgi:4'-phosphopantetheinyl transferase